MRYQYRDFLKRRKAPSPSAPASGWPWACALDWHRRIAAIENGSTCIPRLFRPEFTATNSPLDAVFRRSTTTCHRTSRCRSQAGRTARPRAAGGGEKGKRPVPLFINEAHDLNGHTLINLKRLMEVVEDVGGRLSVILAGHPNCARNDLRRPTIEKIGYRTYIFNLDDIAGSQRDYIHWLLGVRTSNKAEPGKYPHARGDRHAGHQAAHAAHTASPAAPDTRP